MSRRDPDLQGTTFQTLRGKMYGGNTSMGVDARFRFLWLGDERLIALAFWYHDSLREQQLPVTLEHHTLLGHQRHSTVEDSLLESRTFTTIGTATMLKGLGEHSRYVLNTPAT